MASWQSNSIFRSDSFLGLSSAALYWTVWHHCVRMRAAYSHCRNKCTSLIPPGISQAVFCGINELHAMFLNIWNLAIFQTHIILYYFSWIMRSSIISTGFLYYLLIRNANFSTLLSLNCTNRVQNFVDLLWGTIFMNFSFYGFFHTIRWSLEFPLGEIQVDSRKTLRRWIQSVSSNIT